MKSINIGQTVTIGEKTFIVVAVHKGGATLRAGGFLNWLFGVKAYRSFKYLQALKAVFN